VGRALRIARWYGRRTRRLEVADLESAALEGLAKAARDFNPHARKGQRPHRNPSFWNFAFKRILGEMQDELRRLDHLTRGQRAVVAENESGQLVVQDNDLGWMNPHVPLPLDSTITNEDSGEPLAIVDLVEEPHSTIEKFELRDAFCRAGAELSERERFVFVKREIEGYSNSELARAFDVTEGRASQLRSTALDLMRRQIGDSFLDAA
jgi:RNA polymerase sigma factor for flagellar operon FliA